IGYATASSRTPHAALTATPPRPLTQSAPSTPAAATQMESTAPPKRARDKPRPASLPPTNTNSSSTLPTSRRTIDTSAPAPHPRPIQTKSDGPPLSLSWPAPHLPTHRRRRSCVLRPPHTHHSVSSRIAHSPRPHRNSYLSPRRKENIWPTSDTQTESAPFRTTIV